MYINIGNVELFFDVYGSKLKILRDRVFEKPTMIVLHGGHGFADHTLYVEFWSQFSSLVQVIFLDQRGCGRSDLGMEDDWNLQRWAEDLYLFCEKLSIKKPIIAGVSMGGHVICEFISNYKDVAGGLILCNTEARFSLDIICEKLQIIGGNKVAEACRNFYTNPTDETLAQYNKYCIPYYAKHPYTQEELDRCIKHPEVFLHYCQHEILKFNYLNELEKIHCPTLLLVGDKSLHVVEAAEEMAVRIDSKYLTKVIFNDCGAPVYKDNPVESYQVVKKFLQSHQRQVSHTDVS